MDSDLEALWVKAAQVSPEGVRTLLREIAATRALYCQTKFTGMPHSGSAPKPSVDLLHDVELKA